MGILSDLRAAQKTDFRQKWVAIGLRGLGFPGDGNADAVNNSFNSWTRFFVPAGRKIRAVRFGWSRCDITSTGEVNRAVDITNFAASTVIGTTVYQLYFGGQKSTTLFAGRDILWCDPLWVDFGSAADGVIRGYGKWVGSLTMATTPSGTVVLAGEGCNRGTDLADRTMDAYNAAAPANSGGGYFPPVAIQALLDDETIVVGFLTDSHGKGTGDTAAAATFGFKGYLQKSLRDEIPWVYTGCGGTRLEQFAARDDGCRAVLMSSAATDLVLHLVTNDMWIGRSKAQILSDQKAIADRFRPFGVRTWVITCPPRTTGTYTSAAGQTLHDAVRELVRLDYNADIRENHRAYGHAGVIDVARWVEDRANPGKWASDGGALTDDGVHMNTNGHDRLVAARVATKEVFLRRAGL